MFLGCSLIALYTSYIYWWRCGSYSFYAQWLLAHGGYATNTVLISWSTVRVVGSIANCCLKPVWQWQKHYWHDWCVSTLCWFCWLTIAGSVWSCLMLDNDHMYDGYLTVIQDITQPTHPHAPTPSLSNSPNWRKMDLFGTSSSALSNIIDHDSHQTVWPILFIINHSIFYHS